LGAASLRRIFKRGFTVEADSRGLNFAQHNAIRTGEKLGCKKGAAAFCGNQDLNKSWHCLQSKTRTRALFIAGTEANRLVCYKKRPQNNLPAINSLKLQ